MGLKCPQCVRAQHKCSTICGTPAQCTSHFGTWKLDLVGGGREGGRSEKVKIWPRKDKLTLEPTRVPWMGQTCHQMAQGHLKSIRGNWGDCLGSIQGSNIIYWYLIDLIILGPTSNRFHTSILMMANLCADSAQKLTSLRQHCWVFLIFINFALNWHLGADGEIWSSSFFAPK